MSSMKDKMNCAKLITMLNNDKTLNRPVMKMQGSSVSVTFSWSQDSLLNNGIKVPTQNSLHWAPMVISQFDIAHADNSGSVNTSLLSVANSDFINADVVTNPSSQVLSVKYDLQNYIKMSTMISGVSTSSSPSPLMAHVTIRM